MIETFPFWSRCILVFFAAFFSDWCFALYIRRAAEGRPHFAAWWSMLIVAFGAVNVISYTKDIRLLAPMLMGYYFGTFAAVYFDHKKQRTKTI